jgi:hypothetical protein
MALMEPGKDTKDELEPESPNHWGKEIRDFLRQTQIESLAVLKHVRPHIPFSWLIY